MPFDAAAAAVSHATLPDGPWKRKVSYKLHAASIAFEELWKRDPQGLRDILEILERGIALGQLDACEIDAVDTSLFGEPLLRPSALRPQEPDSAGERFRGRRGHRTSTLWHRRMLSGAVGSLNKL